MSKWHDCKNEKPKHRKQGNTELSETVLLYDGKYHSIGFYDFKRNEWKDVTVNAYISDMYGDWMYMPKIEDEDMNELEKYVAIKNSVTLICFTILAIVFSKWWIALFSIPFYCWIDDKKVNRFSRRSRYHGIGE